MSNNKFFPHFNLIVIVIWIFGGLQNEEKIGFVMRKN